ncbi:bifunctional enoyl-CoA hydratase/phosphate acetyltransferase [Rhodanobacter sp. T12-5]|uniref:bifunctional enoyl-CoA hydratase/phosphate acetyltransferase n=1 Tax=Rhodanobacter sp. T12-5 TaxID=2024611 RepID=UPI0011EEEBC5|nr:bifunctional enoyl-CoA hydratase/phosphate acetyltransferase [Rhodanobacter sp. T12-5]KAA0068334.1 bifunctional enoyl-CoA hydratase/phosphate acetyltransferase [Rhodanobacter sp. T12-5]
MHATSALAAPACIENRTFDEIEVGDSARTTRTLSQRDIGLFAAMSGDMNPLAMDTGYARDATFHRVAAHGMWGGSLISALLATQLPGPGTIYLSQDLHFHAPINVGDTIEVIVAVTGKDPLQHRVTMHCCVRNQYGTEVILGTAEVQAPTEKVRCQRVDLPEVQITDHRRFRQLLAQVKGRPAIPTAIVHPCDDSAIVAAVEAANAGLIEPILVGPATRIMAAAKHTGLDIAPYRLVDMPHSHAAAAQAVALVKSGEAKLLMKGSLHTDELMHAVVAEPDLRTGRRLSHVYLMDVPSYPRLLLVTDAAINISPGLDEKRDIIQNAIDLAHILGIAMPKVAVLSAVETVNPAIPSTIDAAALCKMAERGQITGGLVDGPLAFDNAVSTLAASEKGIDSKVAGMADILVVPDLESGNMLAKQLTFLAGADAAGVVMGAQVPIILTSRADAPRARIASCAVAVLLVQAATNGVAPAAGG